MAALRVLGWILGIFLIVLIIGLTVRGIGSFFSNGIGLDRERDASGLSEEEVRRDFQNELVRRASMKGMLPIGGFDADTLMHAFPGLRASDFEGVFAVAGQYSYTDGGLDFLRDKNAHIQNERALSIEGYDQLLENLQDRFAVSVQDQRTIDELIQEIEVEDKRIVEGEVVEVKQNERAFANDVSFSPLMVLEDSRCTKTQVCVNEGAVRVKTFVRDRDGENILVFTLGEPLSIGSVTVTLVKVSSYPSVSKNEDTTDHSFTFRIQRDDT